MNPKQDLINTYLWFSYLPPKEMPTWLDECIKPEFKGASYTAREAVIVFDKVFDALLAEKHEGKHILPLSGGWDSRAILGALLERVDKSQIETVTFGAPGQLDYDIGLKVAKWAGVKYHALDLRTVDFTWDRILESVKKSPWSCVPDGYFNQLAINLVEDKNKIIWSGFLNDAITGGHLSSLPLDFNTQKYIFIQHEQRAKSLFLCDSKFNINSALSINNINTKLFLDDALLFGLHCTNYTTPINLPGIVWKRWSALFEESNKELKFIAPFVDEIWAGYWFQAPRELRLKQNLYLEMLKYKFPGFYTLPCKNRLGYSQDEKLKYHFCRIKRGVVKRIQRKAPWLRIRTNISQNYLDYDEMFRNRKDYQETLFTAFDYLKNNSVVPWLDLGLLWNKHKKRRKDFGDVFVVLIGLAANLTVNNDNNNLQL